MFISIVHNIVKRDSDCNNKEIPFDVFNIITIVANSNTE